LGDVFFYHLTERKLDAVLPPLLARSLAQGWRVELRGRDAARMAALDIALWRGEGFVPHGVAGGPHDGLQPVLLTTAPAGAGFACVMAVDGADLDPAEMAGIARGCILFDGTDPAAVEAARGQWRALTGAGVGAKYWAEADGRWEMKMERPAATPAPSSGHR
jgi:DNA polymerase-3 subunit chi